MASATPPPSDGSEQQPKREPVSPAKRKRLQQAFEKANQLAVQESWDYASELFGVCVAGDPENAIYLQSFLANLKRKYNNNKKGSKAAFIKGAGLRRAVSKAAGQKDWDGVIKTGVDALKLNPWDVSTLTAMADAVCKMGFGLDDVELAYLRAALEANANAADVNRRCAVALRRRKRFDEAIACWHRVEKARPGDQEAVKEIARLAVEKTIDQGGYEETDPSKKRMPGAPSQPPAATPDPAALLPPEQRLERQIAKNPNDLPKYIELADVYIRLDRYDKAEEVLARGVEASGGDTQISERWEDLRVRRLRREVAKADRQLEQTGGEEANKRRQELTKQLNDTEIEVYEKRCRRYPANHTFQFDLGLRYQLAGRYKEAIAQFQQARSDPRRRGLCMLALGQCFQKIKQQRLAMTHYESAISEIPDRDGANRKQAFYLAGKMALELKDVDKAEQHLTALAELDFTFKDVSSLLEKVAQLREDEKGPDSGPK